MVHGTAVAKYHWSDRFALAQPMTFTGSLDQDQDDIKAPLAQLT
jgi:hypothetical protein